MRPSQSFQNARELVLSRDSGHSDLTQNILLTQNIPERMSFCVFEQSTPGSGPEASDGVKDTSLLPAEHRTSQGPPAGASLRRPSPPRAGEPRPNKGAEDGEAARPATWVILVTPRMSSPPPGCPRHPRVVLITPRSSSSPPGRPHHPWVVLLTPGSSSSPPGHPRHPQVILITPGTSSPSPGRPRHPQVVLATPRSPVADPPHPCRGAWGVPVTAAVTSPFIHMLDQIWEM